MLRYALILTVAVMAVALCPVSIASAASGCTTKKCEQRVSAKKAAKEKRKAAADRRWCRKNKACRERVEVKKLTPFRGPNGTRWAVPWRVVYCESGTSGLWRAANPSGAVGPYQLLGHGAPFPASTRATRNTHHRIAARLYRTRGLQPWVSSRHCWG